jgi:hypothetical protein
MFESESQADQWGICIMFHKDRLKNREGDSIFTKLADFSGKFVMINIQDRREAGNKQRRIGIWTRQTRRQ